MENHLEALGQVKSSILDMAVRFGPKVLVAIIILIAGYMAGRWAGGLVNQLLLRFKLGEWSNL